MGDEVGRADGSWRGRRDWRWMTMWPVSILAGGFYGFAVVWVAVLYVWVKNDGEGLGLNTAEYAGRSVAFGVGYAVAGAVSGLVVALVLTLLVGDARGPKAERAAWLVGGGSHAVAALVLMALVRGGFGMFLWMLVASGLVSFVAGRWHRRLASTPPAGDFYAH